MVRVFDAGARDRPAVATDRVWTVANLLSLLRVLALPLVYADLVGGRLVRGLVVLAVFAATDWLDGYVARRFQQVSRLGTLLDPISDRLLFVVVGIAMVVSGLLPVWAIVVLLARDVAVLAAGVVLLSRGRRPPPVSRLGKVATFGLMWALPGFVLAAALGDGPIRPQPVVHTLAWLTYAVNLVLYYLAAGRYARTLAATRQADARTRVGVKH